MKNLVTRFNNLPISRKLATIVLLTSGLLISFMGVAISVEKSISFRKKLISNTAVLAEVIGANTSAALIYRDQDTALEMLTALQAENDVISAALYNKNGKIFISYNNSNNHDDISEISLPREIDSSYAANRLDEYDDYFDTIHTIRFDQEKVGYIILRTDLQPLQRQLSYFWILITVLGSLLLGVAMVLCIRLNKSITDPISQFASTIQTVTSTDNYQIRVEKVHNDEIGILADGFNTMLSHIDKRDRELENHRHHLEDLVTVRTTELREINTQLLREIKDRKEAQTKLAHAEKMEAIGTLAGGVAHDLNNILSGIVTYPDLLLLNLPGDSELRKPLETIRSSGKKAAAIVQDLLTLSRRGVKTKEHFDLQELVAEYLNTPELKELLAYYPDVKIDFEEKKNTFPLVGSPLHLSKTIMNLVNNGIEAMENGGQLTIDIEKKVLKPSPKSYKHLPKGDYIILTVSDTGVGISQKDLNRIFEPFYSKKVMGKSGTGLGMAVVWGTVEDHNGYISVESKENIGTTFKIYLPAESAAHEKVSPISAEDKYLGAGQKILIVDDSEEQRQIASTILTHLGYVPEAVGSGEAAIEYLQEKSVDLVILDMLMPPGIDGLETFKKIIEIKPNQKALIASGYSHPSHIEEAHTLGVLAYVMKPYSVTHIGEAVSAALKKISEP